MISMIRNMIKQGVISLLSSDNDPYPLSQASSNGKPIKFTRLGTYGICANPPKDSHVLLLSSQGQESVKFGIINDFVNRRKDLKEGEVAIYNTKTGTEILLKEDSTIEIGGTGDFAVRYTELDIKLQMLILAVNAALASKIDGGGAPGTISVDFTDAKVETVALPKLEAP